MKKLQSFNLKDKFKALQNTQELTPIEEGKIAQEVDLADGAF